MRPTRALSLKRERLTALGDGDLAAVNGGSHLCTVGHGASFDTPCDYTQPINRCLSLPDCEYAFTDIIRTCPG